MNKNILIGLLIPFVGTTLGSAMVFLMKKEMNQLLQKILLGFAGGVMMAASVWSLLIPAMNMSSKMGKLAFIPALIGLLLGIFFLLAIDALTPHLHINETEPEGLHAHLKKTTMMVLAVTIHNIPEGMGKKKAFMMGTLSGIVEPIAGLITVLLSSIMIPILPYLLSFAAGAMIYVIVEEMIPEASVGKHSNIATIGFAVGFAVMMVLDVALG